MASTFTPAIGLEQPARNDYQNTWDVPVNANWAAIDGKLGGTTIVPLTNAGVALTRAQALAANLVFSGTISAAIAVTLPAGFGGMFSVLNGTLGAFTTSLGIAGSAGAVVSLPAGYRTLVIADGTNVYLAGQGIPPGTPLPWLANTIPAGFVLPFGQLLNRVTFAGIFATYGTTFGVGDGANTFGMPDLRGKTLAGLDNMGGVAAGILTAFGSAGQAVGAVGGEQSHVLLLAELAAHNHAVTDPGHNHAITDPGHAHNYTAPTQNVSGAGGGNVAANGVFSFQTSAAPTGISLAAAGTGISLASAGSNAAHNNIQPTMLCNWIIKT